MNALANGQQNGTTQQRPRILGPDGQPISPDGFALPNVYSFAGLINQASRTYSWRYDQALKTSLQDAQAMRRDCYLMGLLRERQYPTEQMTWHLEPENPKDAIQAQVSTALTMTVKAMPRLRRYLRSLLEALWYGRSAAQQAWDWTDVSGARVYNVVNHQHVNGDKVQFGWDGVPRVMIYSPAAAELEAQGATCTTFDRGTLLVLDKPYWRTRFAIHKHDCVDADFFQFEESGGIHGLGIRHWIYWYDWLKKELLGWLLDFMERTGLGLTIYFYEQGNPQSEAAAQKAAKEDGRNTVVVWPVQPGGNRGTGQGVERIETSVTGAEYLRQVIDDYFDARIERFIVGQTLSSGTEGSGLGGSGVAKLHADTKYRIIKDDAENLAETLTEDLVAVLQRFNYPWAKFKVRWVFDVDQPNPEEKLKAAKVLFDMRIPVKMDEVRSVAGFSKPEPGDEVAWQSPAPQLPARGVDDGSNLRSGQPPAREVGEQDQQYSRDDQGNEHAPGGSPEGGRFVGLDRPSHHPGTTEESTRLAKKIASHGHLQSAHAMNDGVQKAITSKTPAKDRNHKVRQVISEHVGKIRGHLDKAADAAISELSALTGKPAEKFKAVRSVAKSMSSNIGTNLANRYRDVSRTIHDLVKNYPEGVPEEAMKANLTVNDIVNAYQDAMGDRGLEYDSKGNYRHWLVDVLDKHFLGDTRSVALRDAHSHSSDFVKLGYPGAWRVGDSPLSSHVSGQPPAREVGEQDQQYQYTTDDTGREHAPAGSSEGGQFTSKQYHAKAGRLVAKADKILWENFKESRHGEEPLPPHSHLRLSLLPKQSAREGVESIGPLKELAGKLASQHAASGETDKAKLMAKVASSLEEAHGHYQNAHKLKGQMAADKKAAKAVEVEKAKHLKRQVKQSIGNIVRAWEDAPTDLSKEHEGKVNHLVAKIQEGSRDQEDFKRLALEAGKLATHAGTGQFDEEEKPYASDMVKSMRKIGSEALKVAKMLTTETKQPDTSLKFVPHPNSGPHETMVYVDPAKMDESWKNDAGFHLPKEGMGKSEIKGRRDGFKEFMKKGKPIEAPRVNLSGDTVDFIDGRHRFAVLRDMGVKKVGVMVSKDDAEKFRDFFGPDSLQSDESPVTYESGPGRYSILSRVKGFLGKLFSGKPKTAEDWMAARAGLDPAKMRVQPIRWEGGAEPEEVAQIVEALDPEGVLDSTIPIAEDMGPDVGPLNHYLYAGEWVQGFRSSNVKAFRYLIDDHKLEIEYKNGNYYQYDQVTPAEALSLAVASSKGTWVWDNLRVRGTVYGYKKPYLFLDAPSKSAPRWFRDAYTRQKHGEIGPSGEDIYGHIPGTDIYQTQFHWTQFHWRDDWPEFYVRDDTGREHAPPA